MVTKEELDVLHKAVPPEYYQQGIEQNFLQRYWHGRRFAVIRRELSLLHLTGPVLDVGCHSGDLTNIIATATQQPVYGVDISPAAIAYAKQRFPAITFLEADFPPLASFGNNFFSAVTFFDVLEHIPETDKVVAEVARLLQPNGYCVVAIPNENWLFKMVWALWMRRRGSVWKDVHVHDFKKEGFIAFERHGFKKIVEQKIIGNMWWFVIFQLQRS